MVTFSALFFAAARKPQEMEVRDSGQDHFLHLYRLPLTPPFPHMPPPAALEEGEVLDTKDVITKRAGSEYGGQGQVTHRCHPHPRPPNRCLLQGPHICPPSRTP